MTAHDANLSSLAHSIIACHAVDSKLDFDRRRQSATYQTIRQVVSIVYRYYRLTMACYSGALSCISFCLTTSCLRICKRPCDADAATMICNYDCIHDVVADGIAASLISPV